MKSERVSVIVPLHNVEAWLDRCVGSLVRQSYEDLEIVLVDDGSTDRTGAQAEAWAARDDRVRVVHKANGGAASARNKGLSEATGSRVAFVDSDDWVHPRFVEHLVRLAEGRTDVVAVCGFQRVSDGEAWIAREDDAVATLTRTEALEALVGARHILLTVPWGKLYPRDLFRGVEFPTGRLVEDEFTTYRVLARASHVVISEAKLYHYWQRPDSLMGSGFSLRRGLDAIDAYRERAEAIRELGYADVAREADRQLLRQLLRLHRWLRQDEPLRVRLRAEMRSVSRRVGRGGHPSPFDLFAGAYVAWPPGVEPWYRLYAAVSALRQRRPRESR